MKCEGKESKTSTPFLVSAKLPHFWQKKLPDQEQSQSAAASPCGVHTPPEMSGRLSSALPHAGQCNCMKAAHRIDAAQVSLFDTC